MTCTRVASRPTNTFDQRRGLPSPDTSPVEIATDIGTGHRTNQGQLRPNDSAVPAATTHTATSERRVGRHAPLGFAVVSHLLPSDAKRGRQ